MEIYGADFSGAKDPSKGIYYTKGVLENNIIRIVNIFHCDDRLDLFSKIVSSDAHWGLDFPFSIAGLNQCNLANWTDLLDMVSSKTRDDFMEYIEDHFHNNFNAGCQHGAGIGCRQTDIQSESFSPLKLNNPNMRAMTYAGLKLLHYLIQQNVSVYPFIKKGKKANLSESIVYEVYPSHLWRSLHLPRANNLQNFNQAFVRLKTGVTIDLAQLPNPLDNLDMADSVIACITMAVAITQYNVDRRWDNCPLNATPAEWRNRVTEGLIVRALQ